MYAGGGLEHLMLIEDFTLQGRHNKLAHYKRNDLNM